MSCRISRVPVAPVPFNTSVPAELERIINKALEKDRDLRFQHASELRGDLKRVATLCDLTPSISGEKNMKTEPMNLPDLAQRYTAARCSHDPARVAACYSANGALTVNGGTPAVGHEAITAVAQECITAFPDSTVLMDVLNVYGETVV